MIHLLNKYGNIVLTTTTGHRVRYHLYILLVVHLTGYIVNLSDFYSYRLIGKLTTFFRFRSFVSAIRSWILPLPPNGFLYPVLTKTEVLRVTLNLDGTPKRGTQCIRDV